MGIDLSGIVVNLRQISRLVSLDWYDIDTGKAYFHIVGEAAYYSVNVNNEIIRTEDPDVTGRKVKYHNPRDKEALLQTGEFVEVPHSNELDRVLAEPDELAARILIAVLRHQVVGDKLTKGLRLYLPSFTKYNVTVKDHYFGGYLVTKRDDNGKKIIYRMSSVLKSVFNVRKSNPE